MMMMMLLRLLLLLPLLMPKIPTPVAVRPEYHSIRERQDKQRERGETVGELVFVVEVAAVVLEQLSRTAFPSLGPLKGSLCAALDAQRRHCRSALWTNRRQEIRPFAAFYALDAAVGRSEGRRELIGMCLKAEMNEQRERLLCSLYLADDRT